MNKQPVSINHSYKMTHEWVDLGLSVKWATCNLGAYIPEETGDYFAFGMVHTLLHYSEEDCDTPHTDIGGSGRDMARANWGSPWRLPTKKEIQELIDNCEWMWNTRNTNNGYLITSNINGKYIFLPAAGNRWETRLDNIGLEGNYWSSTPYAPLYFEAVILSFNAEGPCISWRCEGFGFSVRPVKE